MKTGTSAVDHVSGEAPGQVPVGRPGVPTPSQPDGGGGGRRSLAFPAYLLALAVVFGPTLLAWARHVLQTDTQSYAILLPFICWYLLKTGGVDWKSLREPGSKWGFLVAGLAAAVLTTHWILVRQGAISASVSLLSLPVMGFLLLVLAGFYFFIGQRFVRRAAFPLSLMLFAIPAPPVVLHMLQVFLQHLSASAVEPMYWLAGTPVSRDGLVFMLPRLTIRVAEECSGVNSTLVLFLVSLIAGQLFLKSPWRRAILALVVLPLGILRNAIRIFTITMLSVHVDERVIDSALHHRGGPIFFAISLIPFFGLLYFLRRAEIKRPPVGEDETKVVGGGAVPGKA